MNSRKKDALALIPATVVGIWWIWIASWQSFGQRQFTLFDDAMISMTYGRTLSQTGELVWYPGAPRVEGFTNPLWTLYMAGIHRLGFENSSAALIVALTGLACVIGAAYLAGKVARYLAGDSQWVVTGAILATSLSFPALYWSTRGMEVGLELLLAMVVLVNALVIVEGRYSEKNSNFYRYLWLVLAVLLGVWTRLDFAILCVALILWVLFIARKDRPRKAVAFAVAGALLGAIVTQTLWRLQYYGELFPNTYYLKVEGHSLMDRLLRGQWTTGKLAITLALGSLGLVALIQARDGLRRRVSLLLAMSVIFIVGYSTYVGGDAWDEQTFGNRYAVPVYALCAVLFVAGMNQLLHDRKLKLPLVISTIALAILGLIALRAYNRGSIILDLDLPNATGYLALSIILLVLVGLFIALSFFKIHSQIESKFWRILFKGSVITMAVLSSGSLSWMSVVANSGPKVTADQRYADYGRLVQETLPVGTTTAVVWAGAPVYYSHLPAYDLLGKSDAVIAHEKPQTTFKPGHDKFDYAYSIGVLKPDVIYELFMATPGLETFLKEQGYVVRCYSSNGRVNDSLRLWSRNDTKAFAVSHPCAA